MSPNHFWLIGFLWVGAGVGVAQPVDTKWDKLLKVDQITIEIDKAVSDAGVEFTEFRWYSAKAMIIAAKVKPTKGPLGKEALGYIRFNKLNQSKEGGQMIIKDLKQDEIGLALVSVANVNVHLTTKVVVRIVERKKEKR